MREGLRGQLTTYWPMIQQRSPDFAGLFSVPENFFTKGPLDFDPICQTMPYDNPKILFAQKGVFIDFRCISL